MTHIPTLAYDVYKDKVLAGWIGKSIGGVIGAPLECQKDLKDLALDQLWPAQLAANDDLDLQVLWLEAMQERGLYLTSEDLKDLWQDRCWYSFCEYGVFLNNVQRGIAPPLSGTWNNDFFWQSEGCPIRSDIWGFVAPGNPWFAAELAQMDGQLDHGGISVQLEQFLAAASSQALLTDQLEEALAAGLSVIPVDSPIAQVVERVRQIAGQYPDSRQAWRVTIREFGHRNANHAITNHALMLLALFQGRGDLKRTMQLCANFGWDTDCTASTAGALLATLCGTAGLPADWVEKMGKDLICGINVKHANASLEAFAEDTCRIGVEMSLTRNFAIRITGAPNVEVRPAPAPAVTLTVQYETEPVLWNGRPTRVTIHIANPFETAKKGRLSIAAPEGLHCQWDSGEVELAPGGVRAVAVSISRSARGGWITDKNLLTADWSEDDHLLAQRVFGLGGARQWQIYGPYWDMWDKNLNEVCPYSNADYQGGPFMKGLTGDCYNHYGRIDDAYLDETRLLREDIPEEVPLLLELGTDHFNQDQMGGFTGQACYYLVRTIRSTLPGQVSHLVLGRMGPFHAWLDGVEIGRAEDIRAWAHLDNANCKVTLSGQPQRLVIKLARLTDAYDFSLYAMGPGSQDGTGVSNILDCLEDLAPAVGK